MKEAGIGTLSNDSVTVHAIGPGYGESIVLMIGRRIVLGIDCCSALIQPTMQGSSYLQQILAKCHKRPHIVWLITHYHFDHFQSFTRLLDVIGDKIAKLVVPGDNLSADLGQLAREAESDESPQTFYLAKDELSRLRGQLRTMPLARRVDYFGGTGPHLMFGAEFEFGSTKQRRRIPIRADVFAPRYDLSHKIRKNAVKQLLAGVEKRSAANHSSYVVRVRAGRFEALLLGDSPAVCSARCSVASDPTAEVFLLKVAHHGAKDGTSKSFLKELRIQAKERIALICPFKVRKLPTPSVLRLLQQSGFQIRIVGPNSPSGDLKERLLSQTHLPLDRAALKIYGHESNVCIIESRL